MSYIDRTAHIHKYGGDIWYVNGLYGSDFNSGKRPDKAFATIGIAIYTALPGDVISIATGTYNEHGLEIVEDDIELLCETGVMITDSTDDISQTLLLSGDRCYIRNLHVHQVNQIGINVVGNECNLENIHTDDTTKGFQVSGYGNHFVDCHNINPTVAGFEITSNDNTFHTCASIGFGGATRGFYISSADANYNTFIDCVSTGNNTAGYYVVTGASFNTFKDCSSGGGDGPRVDNGYKTQWAGFRSILVRENHEHLIPQATGEGDVCAPITVNNISGDATGTSSDQYYWGEPKLVVPIDTFDRIWSLLGYNIFGETTVVGFHSALMRIRSLIVASKYTGGGDQNWDEGETVLTVTDAAEAALFMVDDLVWVTSSTRTDGEIVRVTDVTSNVITIERETVASGRTGLRWNHSTDGDSEKLYLVKRESILDMHTTEFCFSCASSKDFTSARFVLAREFASGDGLLIRTMNTSDDGDAEFDFTAIYSET